jgi:hypothetical protein
MNQNKGKQKKMGSRTVTVRNPNHPHNMRDAVGKRAKDHARTLSNTELDKYLCGFVGGAEDIAEFLAQPRNKKIKFIQNAAKAGFVEEWNTKVAEAEEAAKAEKETNEDG